MELIVQMVAAVLLNQLGLLDQLAVLHVVNLHAVGHLVILLVQLVVVVVQPDLSWSCLMKFILSLPTNSTTFPSMSLSPLYCAAQFYLVLILTA